MKTLEEIQIRIEKLKKRQSEWSKYSIEYYIYQDEIDELEHENTERNYVKTKN